MSARGGNMVVQYVVFNMGKESIRMRERYLKSAEAGNKFAQRNMGYYY